MERFRVMSCAGLAILAATGCSSLGPDSCEACDVTGLWVGRFQSDGTSANGNFFVDIQQNGTALSGTFTSSYLDLENGALTGTQEGGAITFQEGSLNISFEGTVSEDMTASGDYHLGSLDVGEWWASRAQTGGYQMADCFDLALEHRPNGLAYDGTDFWVVTGSDVLRVDAAGTVLSEFERPGPSVGGDPKAAFVGGSLWYVNGFEIVEMNTAGNELSRHEDPEMAYMEGIAGVGGNKWVTEYFGDLLQVDGSLNISRTVETPVRSASAMAWDGSLMWVVSNFTFLAPVLYAVDLSGWVRAFHQLPQGIRATDLTFDGQSLWLADIEAQRVCRLAASP